MLNRNSPEPMYIQIANILRKEIGEKKHSENKTIGTHKELAERFGVSLITIRNTIQVLTDENLLVTKPGKGTFVVQKPMQDGFNRLAGMSTVMAMNNLVAEVKVINMEFITPPISFPEQAREALGDNCLFIERTHSVGDEVIGLAHIFIPEHYGNLFSFKDVSENTIYSLLSNKLNVQLGKGLQNITAIPAESKIADILHVPKKSPLLMLERFSYNSDQELIEYMLIYYNHEKYSFQVELDLLPE